MARCPSCDYPIPEDRERVGARCPNCRDPLYEPAARHGRPAREEGTDCAAHAGMESVGACARCGLNLCETCRTRWRGQIICAACADRALASSEATPEQARATARHALLSLAFGGGAWLLSGLAVLLLDRLGRSAPVGLTFALVLVVIANGLAAAVGAGQAVAALRQSGERRAQALAGLVLGGLYAGALLGAGTFFVWQN